MAAQTVPSTVENWGRLIGYTWGEVTSRTWGNINKTPYGILKSFVAAKNASSSTANRAKELNEILEQSNLFKLSELETLFKGVETATDNLNKALG